MFVDELIQDSPEYSATLYRTQIVTAALTMGVVIFLIIALFVPAFPPGKAPMPGGPLITLFGIAFTVLDLIARRILLPFITKIKLKEIARSPKPNQIGEICLLFATRTIVGTALIEAPAFFMVIAYMMERHPAALGTVLLLIVGIAMQITTKEKYKAWLDTQFARLEELSADA